MIRKLFIALLLACAPAYAQVQSGGVSLAPGAAFFQSYTAGGTITAGHLIVLDASNHAIEVAASATSGVIGVAQGNATTGNSVNVAYIGQQPVIVDGLCLQGYYIVISSSAGIGHCQPTVASGQEEVGVSFSTIASAGQVTALLSTATNQSSGGGPAFVASTVNSIGLQVTPANPGAGQQSFEVNGTIVASAVPNVQGGSQFCVPAYSQAGIANIVGPTGVCVSSDLQSVNTPKNLTVGGAVTIGSVGNPFSGFTGTLQPSGCTAPGAGLYRLWLADEVTALPLWSTGSAACEPFAVQTLDATFGNLTVTGTCTGCASFIYPAAGVVVSTGSAWGSSLTAPTGAIVGTSDTQTLTNKTVDGVTPTVFGYLDASSSIQTQLNAKASSSAATTVNGQTCTLSSTCTIEPNIVLDTSTPVTVSGTNVATYHNNQNATAATAITYDLPTAAGGIQKCFTNSYNGSAADTGTLELLTSASGQFIIFTDGTLSATGGYVISGGAASDAACVVGIDSTHWQLYVQRGTWTKH